MCALFRFQCQQVRALEQHFTLGDLIALASGQDMCQCALAGAVRPHDGVYLTGTGIEVQAAQDGLVLDGNVQITDSKHVCSSPFSGLADRAFQRDIQQFLCFCRELQRQLLEHFLAKTVHQHRHGVFF